MLGIETSCDETAAALLIDGRVVADRTTRQLLHEQFGGVVPELASRAHERLLAPAVEGVLRDAGLACRDVEAIAVTYGPGLAGALLVGLAFAKGISAALGVPYWAVNHLEGHLWSARLTCLELPLPFLALIVSGGHTLLIEVEDFGRYRRLGTTRDDAAGELFDKVGRMIGFPFPAGAAMDDAALAHNGEPTRFPRSRVRRDPFAFSFSGLKTAVLYHLQGRFPQDVASGQFDLPDEDRRAVCAGVMQSVSFGLTRPLGEALGGSRFRALVVSGGVAASKYLRRSFARVAEDAGVPLIIPPIHHCTDNGAMIAHAGYLMMQHGVASAGREQPVDPSADLCAGRSG